MLPFLAKRVQVSMTELNGALVLITGAGGGFGRQMTRQFLAAGSDLILSDIDAAALDELQELHEAEAPRIRAAVTADLSTREGCTGFYDAVQRLGLEPDILVNNAGVAVAGRTHCIPDERWEALMQINLLAPMRLCSLFLPMMIARRSGHIVNISSLAGWVGSPGIAAFCASKFGLHGYSESIAADLEEFAVSVSAVYPYFSKTPILESDQFGYAERRRVPEEELTDPADVVREIIKGVRQNRLHIFPDRTARRVHYIKRLFPWMIPFFNERMQKMSMQSARD
jgi:short-subunit dehydrogenase